MRQPIYETAEGRRRSGVDTLDLIRSSLDDLDAEEAEMAKEFRCTSSMTAEKRMAYERRERDLLQRRQGILDVLELLESRAGKPAARAATPPAPKPAPKPAPVVSRVPTRPAYFSSTAWSK